MCRLVEAAVGCVSTTVFKAADTSKVGAGSLLSGVVFGGVAGNLTLPSTEHVLTGTTYGASGTGSLGSLTLPPAGQVLAPTSYGVAGSGTTGTLTLPAAANVRVANGSFGVDGTSSVPSLSDCSSDGTLACVTVTGYPSAKLANIAVTDIRSGVHVAGLTGTLVGAPAACASDGAIGCLATTSYTAAATCGLAAKVLSGSTVAGVAGNVTLPTIGNVLSATTYGASGTGLAGTLMLPLVGDVLTSITYGASGTGSTGTLTLPAAASVRTANGSYGISGIGMTPTLGDCSTDGTLGCVTATGYPSAKLANFSASNIQTGTTIAGVAGAIANCSTDGSPGCLAVAAFKAADMSVAIASNIISGATIAGVAGSAVGSTACTTDGQQNCSVSGVFTAANVTGISTWDLRAGQTLGGITGALKTNCRNSVNSTYFNWDGAVTNLPNTAQTTGTAFDYWDTIDDYYGLPANKVTAWSSSTYCDSSTWADVTTTNGGGSLLTCASSPAACQYQDQITNLVTTNLVSTSSTWSDAVNACASSTYGGYAAGTWRLPTQKELLSQYEHGIAYLASANFVTLANMQNYFWSSSTYSTLPDYAWVVNIAGGIVVYGGKSMTYSFSCVR